MVITKGEVGFRVIVVECWESNSIGARETSRKDWKLTPMSSFDVEQGDVNSGPDFPELMQTDGPGFSLCATPLESSGPGFCDVEQRLGERVEVQRYTGLEMSERT